MGPELLLVGMSSFTGGATVATCRAMWCDRRHRARERLERHALESRIKRMTRDEALAVVHAAREINDPQVLAALLTSYDFSQTVSFRPLCNWDQCTHAATMRLSYVYIDQYGYKHAKSSMLCLFHGTTYKNYYRVLAEEPIQSPQDMLQTLTAPPPWWRRRRKNQ